MDTPQAKNLIDTHQALMDSLKVPVNIDHGEVIRLVANDLIAKYKMARKMGNTDNAEHLNAVLKTYYLTSEQFDELQSEILQG